jgi:hypothetical protein
MVVSSVASSKYPNLSEPAVSGELRILETQSEEIYLHERRAESFHRFSSFPLQARPIWQFAQRLRQLRHENAVHRGPCYLVMQISGAGRPLFPISNNSLFDEIVRRRIYEQRYHCTGWSEPAFPFPTWKTVGLRRLPISRHTILCCFVRCLFC